MTDSENNRQNSISDNVNAISRASVSSRPARTGRSSAASRRTGAVPRGRKPASRKKRKVRRRIHKGRLAILLTPIVIIIILVFVLCSNYGNPGEIYRAFSDNDEHVTEASEAGRRDAERVLHTAEGSMERDGALLFLHARASKLSMNGYDAAAEDYMNGAMELLRSRNVIK